MGVAVAGYTVKSPANITMTAPGGIVIIAHRKVIDAGFESVGQDRRHQLLAALAAGQVQDPRACLFVASCGQGFESAVEGSATRSDQLQFIDDRQR